MLHMARSCEFSCQIGHDPTLFSRKGCSLMAVERCTLTTRPLRTSCLAWPVNLHNMCNVISINKPSRRRSSPTRDYATVKMQIFL